MDAAVGAVDIPIERSRFFRGEPGDLQASRTAVRDARFCFMSPRISWARFDPRFDDDVDDALLLVLGTVGGFACKLFCKEGLFDTNSSRFCRMSLRISRARVDDAAEGAAIMVDDMVTQALITNVRLADRSKATETIRVLGEIDVIG